jgi:hypothetical protein
VPPNLLISSHNDATTPTPHPSSSQPSFIIFNLPSIFIIMPVGFCVISNNTITVHSNKTVTLYFTHGRPRTRRRIDEKKHNKQEFEAKKQQQEKICFGSSYFATTDTIVRNHHQQQEEE